MIYTASRNLRNNKESGNLVTSELNKPLSATSLWTTKITESCIWWDCLALLWPWHL